MPYAWPRPPCIAATLRLGDYFRRLRAKLGSPSAITAAAHKLARILFAMLRDRRSFDPHLLGILNEKHLRRRQNSLRKYASFSRI